MSYAEGHFEIAVASVSVFTYHQVLQGDDVAMLAKKAEQTDLAQRMLGVIRVLCHRVDALDRDLFASLDVASGAALDLGQQKVRFHLT